MELVDGVDVLTHVVNPETLRRRRVERATTEGGFGEETAPGRTVWDADTLRLEVPFEEDKLRPAVRQIALALAALHRAGKIHRDVKPTNILITRDGRAVLLDLGPRLRARHPDARGPDRRHDRVHGAGAGPGAAAEPAADMYALGAILYEALTGRPPFVGDAVDVLTEKRTIEPLSPSMMYAGIPADLDELCIALLTRDPARRRRRRDVAQGMASGAWRRGR